MVEQPTRSSTHVWQFAVAAIALAIVAVPLWTVAAFWWARGAISSAASQGPDPQQTAWIEGSLLVQFAAQAGVWLMLWLVAEVLSWRSLQMSRRLYWWVLRSEAVFSLLMALLWLAATYVLALGSGR